MATEAVLGRCEVFDATILVGRQLSNVLLESGSENSREANLLANSSSVQDQLVDQILHVAIAQPSSARDPLYSVSLVPLSDLQVSEKGLFVAAAGTRQHFAWTFPSSVIIKIDINAHRPSRSISNCMRGRREFEIVLLDFQ